LCKIVINIMGIEKFLDIRRTATIKISLSNAIWYANDYMLEMMDFDVNELITQPPKIVCNHDMPDIIHEEIGRMIMGFKEGIAVLKHKTKHGDYFWSFTHFKPVYKPDGTFEAFLTRRKPIPSKKIDGTIVDLKRSIEKLYKVLKEIENVPNQRPGVAEKYLHGFLEDRGFETLSDYYASFFDFKNNEIEQYFSIDENTPDKIVKRYVAGTFF